MADSNKVSRAPGRIVVITTRSGNRFRVRENNIAGFMSRNPGARLVTGHSLVVGQAPAAILAAPISQAFAGVTQGALRQLARDHGLPVRAGATRKSLIGSLQAAGVGEQTEEEEEEAEEGEGDAQSSDNDGEADEDEDND